MNTADQRVARMLLEHAREVYVTRDRIPETIAIDRRCPGCGVERDGCDRPLCSRLLSEAEA